MPLRINRSARLALLQPDACLWRVGGTAWFNEEGCIEGRPELVVEVSASTASIDLHAKKTAYRRNRIKEYIVWRVMDDEVDWFVLQGDDYVSLAPDHLGVIQSHEFEGLRLSVPSLLARDRRGVAAAVEGGAASR